MSKNKLVCWMVLLCLVIVFCLPVYSFAAAPAIKVNLRGEFLTLSSQPVVSSGVVLVPMKSALDSLDSYNGYNSKTKIIIAEKKNNSIKLVLGSNIGYINGKQSKLSAAPKLVSNQVYIPLDFVCKAFGFKYDYNKTSNTVNISSDDKSELKGNSSGNIANYGYAAKSGDWIYVSLFSGLYRMKEDGAQSLKIFDYPVSYLNIVGDWVYYVSDNYNNKNEDSKIYKMKLDGSSKTKILDDKVKLINVVDEWIYYIDTKDGKPYRIRIDGKGKLKLSDDNLSMMFVDNGWIYYKKTNDSVLYKSRTNGKDSKKIADNLQKYKSSIIKVGDWVYYLGTDGDINSIYKVKTDGSGKKMVIHGTVTSLNSSDGWIYYMDTSNMYKIKEAEHQKIKIDSKISDNNGDMSIINNWLYFSTSSVSSDDDYINSDYRIKDDGSIKQEFVEGCSIKEVYAKSNGEGTDISKPIILSNNTPGSTLKTVKEIVKQKNAVAKIEIYNKNGELLKSGSGFNIKSSGVVVTNFHVVEGASSIKCSFEGDKSYDVDYVLNYNQVKDIAILQLKDAENLPVLNLDDSDKVELADEVVAIGNPFDYQNTVSTGIISGLRNVLGVKYLQTNAALSPGSSGGPLFDMYGNVIGITSMGISGSQNLNFAVPINSVKSLFDSSRVITLVDLNNEDAAIDEFEDNGSMAFADKFEINQSINGVLSDDNDVDYYQFTVNKKETITFICFGIEGSKELSMTLLDQNGTEITSSALVDEQGVKVQEISKELDEGTYYLRVKKAPNAKNIVKNSNYLVITVN